MYCLETSSIPIISASRAGESAACCYACGTLRASCGSPEPMVRKNEARLDDVSCGVAFLVFVFGVVPSHTMADFNLQATLVDDSITLLRIDGMQKTTLRQSRLNRSPRAVSWRCVHGVGSAWRAFANSGLRDVVRHAFLDALRQLRVES